MATTSYTTKNRVISGLNLVAGDIDSGWLTMADAEIEARTGIVWEQTVAGTILYVDGNEERFIQLPTNYINAITAITTQDINNANDTTVDTDDVSIDNDNATVWRHTDAELSENFEESAPVWPKGIRNCIFTGTFGKATPESIKELATLIVWRKILQVYGKRVDFDSVRYATGRFNESLMKRRSIDEMIEYYFKTIIPVTPSFEWGVLGVVKP